MRVHAITLITIILCVTSITCAAPLLPGEFYGTVYIDGSPAPAGTNITAIIDGQVTGFTITSVPGVFGGTGPFDERLPVAGSADGQDVSFAINGNPATGTAVFHPGTTGQIILSIGAAPAPTASPAPTPTSGATAVPTEKPVVDNEDDPYSHGPTSGSEFSAASRAPAGTLRAPPAPTPAGTASAAATRPAARQSQAAGAVSAPAAAPVSQEESETTGSFPVYTVAGIVIVAIVGFAGYSVYRRWTRWQ